MSIYNLIAFNAATNQMKQNQADAANLEAKRTQTAQAQEDLQNSKTLDLAKAKQAHVEGQISDVTSDAITDALNQKYKAKNDVLDAQSDIQDNLKLKMQDQQQKLQQTAQAHAQNITPDDHAQLGAMLQSIQGGNGALSAPMGPSGGPAATPMAAAAPSNPNIPSIIPQSVAPQMAKNIGGGGLNLAGLGGDIGTPASTLAGQGKGLDAQTTAAGVQQPTQAPAQEAPTAPISPNVAPLQGLPLQGTHGDTSAPVQAATPDSSQSPFQIVADKLAAMRGLPPGVMMLNSKGELVPNPIAMQKIEVQQKAQAMHDVNQQNYEDSREDRNIRAASTILANAAKTGPIAVQNAKVDQAIHARALINQSYDPKTGDFNVTQVPYGELGETLSSLLAGKTGSSDARVAAVKQKTAQGDLNSFLTYWNGKPSNATSQDAIKQTVDIIDRQGEVAENERNNAYNVVKKYPIVNRLNEDDFNYIKSQLPNPGNSYMDELKKAPDKQPKATQQEVPPEVLKNRPQGAAHWSPSTKQFYDAQGNVVK